MDLEEKKKEIFDVEIVVDPEPAIHWSEGWTDLGDGLSYVRRYRMAISLLGLQGEFNIDEILRLALERAGQ